MAGNENSSLPQAFGEVAYGQLLALLSEPFGEVIEQEKKAVPSMPIYNMGAANEGMSEILARAGVDELEVGEWAMISGEREPVNICPSKWRFRFDAALCAAERGGLREGGNLRGEGYFDQGRRRV